jgi:Transcription factor WhiB
MRIDAHSLREAAMLSSRKLQDRTEQRGLCAGDPEHADDWFLPEPHAPSSRARMAYEREAERLCSPCHVRAECLELALRTEATRPAWGIWGGLAPWQRAPLVRARKLAADADDIAATTIRVLTEAA